MAELVARTAALAALLPGAAVGDVEPWTPSLIAVLVACGAPLVAALALGVVVLLRASRPSERVLFRVACVGLDVSALASLATLAVHVVQGPVGGHGEHVVGDWLRLGDYAVPVAFLVDDVSVAFSALAALLTAVTARFSRTYLHRERGFARFFVLLALFGAGAQLVAFAGAFDLFFAGWELLGVSSMLFIGFFFERGEPVRSALRAFATYRLCDVGFFVAVIATHELFGTTRLSVLSAAGSIPAWQRSIVAALFLVAALGKSAQLPFSTWLPRAMEGPTPTSALFYGGVSIHAGLYLLLRVWPLLDTAPVVEVAGVVVGILTALYGTALARVQTDAKGALAHATLAQTGLILAEIAAGLTTLALCHLVGHALLRVWQYLRAPNTLHDAHVRGHGPHAPAWWERALGPRGERWLYGNALHRFRLDDRLDAAVAPVVGLARALDRLDEALRARLSLDRAGVTPTTTDNRSAAPGADR